MTVNKIINIVSLKALDASFVALSAIIFQYGLKYCLVYIINLFTFAMLIIKTVMP